MKGKFAKTFVLFLIGVLSSCSSLGTTSSSSNKNTN